MTYESLLGLYNLFFALWLIYIEMVFYVHYNFCNECFYVLDSEEIFNYINHINGVTSESDGQPWTMLITVSQTHFLAKKTVHLT